jgi:L-asparaginase II
LNREAALALFRAGLQPSSLHNNCSGKHAGFLCLACQLQVDARGYCEPAHPVQREVRAAIEGISGASLTDERRAIDGCSVPTWAVPLNNLALAFARFGTGQGMSAERSRAAARLRAACTAHPWHVAGTDRFCTEVMRLLGTRVFVKTGAEGVYCAALPGGGLGVALKIDDGGTRAAEVAMAAVIARFVELSASEEQGFEHFLHPTLRNWNGLEVGSLRPAAALKSGR